VRRSSINVAVRACWVCSSGRKLAWIDGNPAPFAGSGEVDHDRLREHIDWLIDSGVHGLVPCGSTGEFAALSLEERRTVAEIVISQAAGRVPVVPQTGATRTSDAVALSQHAASAGADAVLVVQPFYEAPTAFEVVEYFRAVGAAAGIPVVVYNLPSGTGVKLTPPELAHIAAEVPNVAYVKDSTGDLEQAYDLIYNYSDRLTPLIGWDTILLPAFAAGAAGTIWGAPNFRPRECVQIFTDATSGNLEAAQRTWDRVWPIMAFLGAEGYAASVKAAARLMGIDIGVPSAPFAELPARSSTNWPNC
jgi:4-hydroxy-tetrahydrodipicolinate synthase